MKKLTHKKSKSKTRQKKPSNQQFMMVEQYSPTPSSSMAGTYSRVKDAYYPTQISSKSKRQNQQPSIITKTRCAYSLPSNLSFMTKVNGIERTLTLQERKLKYLEARLKQKTCFSVSMSGRSASKSKSKRKQRKQKDSTAKKKGNSFIRPSTFLKQNEQLQQINKFQEEISERFSELKNQRTVSNKNSQILGPKMLPQAYFPIEQNYATNALQWTSQQPQQKSSQYHTENDNLINYQENLTDYRINQPKSTQLEATSPSFYVTPNNFAAQHTDTETCKDYEVISLKRKVLQLEALVSKNDKNTNQIEENFSQKLWVYSNRILELEKENQQLLREKDKANDLERTITLKEKQIQTLENYYKEKLEFLQQQNKLLRNKIQFGNIENQFSLSKQSQMKFDEFPLSDKRSQNFTFA